MLPSGSLCFSSPRSRWRTAPCGRSEACRRQGRRKKGRGRMGRNACWSKTTYIGIHGGTVPVSLLTAGDGSPMIALVGLTGSDFLNFLRTNGRLQEEPLFADNTGIYAPGAYPSDMDDNPVQPAEPDASAPQPTKNATQPVTGNATQPLASEQTAQQTADSSLRSFPKPIPPSPPRAMLRCFWRLLFWRHSRHLCHGTEL